MKRKKLSRPVTETYCQVNVEDPVELETPVLPVTVTQSSPSVSDELLVEVPSTSDTSEQTI